MAFPLVPPEDWAPPCFSIINCSCPRIASGFELDWSSIACPYPFLFIWWFWSLLMIFWFGLPVPLVRPTYTCPVASFTLIYVWYVFSPAFAGLLTASPTLSATLAAFKAVPAPPGTKGIIAAAISTVVATPSTTAPRMFPEAMLSTRLVTSETTFAISHSVSNHSPFLSVAPSGFPPQ